MGLARAGGPKRSSHRPGRRRQAGGGGRDCPSPAGVALPEPGERGEVVDAVQAPEPELGGGDGAVHPDEVHAGPPEQLGITWSVPDEENLFARQAMLLDQQIKLAILAMSPLETGVVVEVVVEPMRADVRGHELAGRAAAEESPDARPAEKGEGLCDVGEDAAAEERGPLSCLDLGRHLTVRGMTGEELFELAGEVEADRTDLRSAEQ